MRLVAENPYTRAGMALAASIGTVRKVFFSALSQPT
jgi:hypothetical protein